MVSDNKIIVHPGKFQAVAIPKKKKVILENQFDLIKKGNKFIISKTSRGTHGR